MPHRQKRRVSDDGIDRDQRQGHRQDDRGEVDLPGNRHDSGQQQYPGRMRKGLDPLAVVRREPVAVDGVENLAKRDEAVVPEPRRRDGNPGVQKEKGGWEHPDL